MVKNREDLNVSHRSRVFTVGGRPNSRCRIGSNTPRGNIRVIIRVRPPNDRESGDNNKIVVKVVDEQTIVFDPKEDDTQFFFHGVQQRNRDITKRQNKNLQFTFDRVFAWATDNNGVFLESTQGLIQSFMDGYNCSVFVYGATGAGKTHTMLGCENDPGITVLTINELFKQKADLESERDFQLGISYLEVYNENIQDLLNPGRMLHLREDPKFGVIVAGIKIYSIEEVEDLFKLLKQGSRNRTQHPTDANAESSRSHAIFQVYLRTKFKQTNEVRVAKLSMIDLAGSEKGAATGYSGARFTEGANINKSLLALGNCINGLAAEQRHIPYRDSKLTRLLKDSLGGNCQTVMVANVSPSSLSYEDTYNTLKYATRAKKIKSSTKQNVVNSEVNLKHYENLVEQLRKEIAALQAQLSQPQKADVQENGKDELQMMHTERRTLEEQIQQLRGAEQLALVRKRLKEDSEARLEGIYTNMPNQERYQHRLGQAISCLERQAVNLRTDLVRLEQRRTELETRRHQLLESAPHLKPLAEMEDVRITYLEAKSKAEHLQKVCDLQNGELKMRDGIIRQFFDVLQPCFLQLRGHGYATADLTTRYNGLLRHLQGFRTVTWDETTTNSDSDTNSTKEGRMNDGKRQSPRLKDARLNSTFVLPQTKEAVCSERSPLSTKQQQCITAKQHMMSKVFKPPRSGKILKTRNVLQRT